MHQPAKLSDQIRAAVIAWPGSRRSLAKAVQTDLSNLSRFARGDAGLSLDAIDRLCALYEAQYLRAARQRKTLNLLAV